MIVGIQVGITSGVAFYDQGKVLFAASEERYTKIKNDTAFPEKALQDGIKYLGISKADVDQVVLVSQNMVPDHLITKRECSFSVHDYLREQNEYYYPRFFGHGEHAKDYLDVFAEKIRQEDLHRLLKNRGDTTPQDVLLQWRIDLVQRLLGISNDKIRVLNHEHSHAAYGYYGSPFRGDDVLIVTFDGFGDEANATVSEFADGQIKLLAKYRNFNVGRIYRYITLLLGMKPSEHEFKVMGLAPYATEYTYREALKVFRKSYQFNDDGTLSCDPELRDHFFYYKERLEGCRFDGIAAALQIFTEEMVCKLITHWIRKTGKSRVVLSGGVSLNIKANMEIGKIEEVKDLFVVGSGGDESLCIGSIYAFVDERRLGDEIEPLMSLYLGRDVPLSDCERVIKELPLLDLAIIRDADPACIAHHLADGKVLARVSGRMEFGARALGNRSIIADPRYPSTIRKINSKIKQRDFWMPFTPSILADSAGEYLANPKGFRFPYMSVACETTAKGKSLFPAALHPADETARPQLVERSINPQYYDLLSAFRDITGVGGILNTSLNLHGYPIAQTVGDGMHVFQNSDLDGIILGPHLVMRNGGKSHV